MRTTVDIPDSLMARVKDRIHAQKVTFRTLVISALERALDELDEKAPPFRMRDAAVGGESGKTVSADEINAAIDEQRETGFPR